MRLLFCLVVLEIPSTEIAQKCGRIYDFGVESNINQEGMQVGGQMSQPSALWKDKSETNAMQFPRAPSGTEPLSCQWE